MRCRRHPGTSPYPQSLSTFSLDPEHRRSVTVKFKRDGRGIVDTASNPNPRCSSPGRLSTDTEHGRGGF